MPTITKLVLDFKDADDLPKEEGLKIACFKILEGNKIIGHDWGFASFESGEFEQLEDGGAAEHIALKGQRKPKTINMKISYRTHPVLGLIDGHKNDVMIDRNAPNAFNLITGLNYVFGKYGKELKQNVIIVSKSFQEAATTCADKMIDNELYKETGDELSGVLLFGGLSIVYNAKRTVVNSIGAWQLNIIEFFAGNGLKTFCWEGIANYTQDDGSGETPDVAAKGVWHFVQMVLMFKKFAQVETKELPAGQKVKGVDCKYVNETKSNITYLTSTWFTNLVKSDAFKVRGHFRLQPKKKDGEWTKELIWISDFMKTGYTAPARKLKEEAE